MPAPGARSNGGRRFPAHALSLRALGLSPTARYAIAIGSALLAVLLRVVLDPLWGLRFTFTLLFPAIVVSAWLGGFGPGIVATVLCAVAAAYLWVVPPDSWAMTDTSELLGVLVFVAVGAAFSAISEAWRRTTAELRQSEDRLRVTLNSIGDGVITTDAEGRVTGLNPVAEALTGWSTTECVGRPLEEVLVIINETTRQPVENPVLRVLRDGAVAGLANHTVLVAKDGREIPIDDSAAPIVADSAIVGVVLIFRNVAERRGGERQREELLERERTAHLEAETAMQKLRVALEAGHMGTWEYVIRTGEVKWSPGLEAIHGYMPGAFPGTFEAFRNEIHPDDRERVLDAIGKAAAERHEHHVVYRIIRADGAVRWVEGRGQLFLDESTQPDRMLGVCTDITERRRADERFRLAVEAAPAAMLMVDSHGTIVLANALSEHVLGYRRDELLGQSIDRFVPASARDQHATHRAAFFSDPRPRPMGIGRDLFAVRKDGTEIPVEVGLSPIETADGRFVLAAVTDISDRKHAEQSLRTRTAELEQVLDVIPAAVWIARDPDCHEVFGNKYAAALFGVTPVTDLSQGPARQSEAPAVRYFRAGRELAPSEQPMPRAVASGRPQLNEELEVELPNGKRVTLLGSAAPLTDEHGRTRGVVSAFSDITERKAIEQQRAELHAREHAARLDLERASRLKDEFLAVLSHELRTPLNAILGYANLLKMGALDPDRARHAVTAIHRNAQAQARLIGALLDLSRVMAGKLELDLDDLDVSRVLEAAVDTIRPEADDKGIRVEIEKPTLATVIRGDASRLQQVFWNLLTNAVKFTPRGGRIGVVIGVEDGHALVRVTDTGQGIRPDLLPHVFDRFRQGDTSLRGAMAGLGLGLAVARELVEAHHGRVAAYSAGEGLGSTFTVELPQSGTPETRGRMVSQPASSDDGTRLSLDVLVVDDEGDVRDLLAFTLESRGAQVQTVSSAREALDSIARRRPDVLLADLRMPDEDGYALIRALRGREREHRLPRIAAIAVTAYAASSDRERALAAGFDAHVTKPVDAEELVRAIARVVKVAGRSLHSS